MPEKFVPYEKMGKKQKRALDLMRRKDWSGVRPVTRKIESEKKYDRRVKHKKPFGEEF